MEGLKDDPDRSAAQPRQTILIKAPMSWPASLTLPASARSRPATTAISELLPDPDGPSTATLSPRVQGQAHAFQDFGADIALAEGQPDVVQRNKRLAHGPSS